MVVPNKLSKHNNMFTVPYEEEEEEEEEEGVLDTDVNEIEIVHKTTNKHSNQATINTDKFFVTMLIIIIIPIIIFSF